MATNMCIQHVQLLDLELSLQYPHLSTPYRLLSRCVLPDITSDVASIMREHAAEKSMEKAPDPWNRAEYILPEFCLEYKVDSRGEEKLREIVYERSRNKDVFVA